MQKGQIVLSKAGRNKDCFLVVLDYDRSFCYIADGKAYPVERPKKKNLKHVAVTTTCLSEENLVTNRAVRAALFAYRNHEKMNSERGHSNV